MLTIIHGDNQFSSRLTLDQIKKSQSEKNLEIIDVSSLTLTKLVQMVEGGSLFGEDKAIIIENLLSQKIKENGQIFEYLRKMSPEVNCTIWESKEISKTTLANFPKAKILLFKIEKRLFRFLDTMRPGNFKISLALFHEVLNQEAPEMVFFMIIRTFRHLILIKSQSAFIDNLSPWQQQKTISQAKEFSLEHLKKVYEELLDIDYSIKSGRSALNLEGRLDIFLLNL